MLIENTDSPATGRLAVLFAAAKTFARLGYDGARIDDIAAELGSTKGRVYHHYESKSRIVEDLLDYGADKFIESAEPIAKSKDLSPKERIERMAIEHVLLLVQPERGVQAVALVSHHIVVERGNAGTQSSLHFKHIVAKRDKYQGLWRKVIEQGKRDGSFHAPDIGLAVRAVLGTLNSVATWYRPAPSDTAKSRRAIAEGLAQFVLSGLCGQAGANSK